MSLVLDASVACAWILPDERLDAARADAVQRLVATGGAVVPALWPSEVVNVLIKAHRRDRLSRVQVDQALNALAVFDIRPAEFTPPMPLVASLGLTWGLTAYDAVYLATAQGLGLPLATLDAQLAKAAGLAGVALA
jgi:predicted nucleic acid-binding protein